MWRVTLIQENDGRTLNIHVPVAVGEDALSLAAHAAPLVGFDTSALINTGEWSAEWYRLPTDADYHECDIALDVEDREWWARGIDVPDNGCARVPIPVAAYAEDEILPEMSSVAAASGRMTSFA